jgi:hypothetical protein
MTATPQWKRLILGIVVAWVMMIVCLLVVLPIVMPTPDLGGSGCWKQVAPPPGCQAELDRLKLGLLLTDTIPRLIVTLGTAAFLTIWFIVRVRRRVRDDPLADG